MTLIIVTNDMISSFFFFKYKATIALHFYFKPYYHLSSENYLVEKRGSKGKDGKLVTILDLKI